MRPLKLRMSAFGPYTNEVCLDLSILGTSGIYLITGDTGSGKTTIFDGIVYALYGKPSGANRDEGMLRSKGASPSVPTEVELEFLCKGKEYKILRSPAYSRPKKSGDGLTNEPARVELHLPNGRAITNTKEANTVIEEIIGLNREQFLQIAMIAQGEFLKLLFASTDERIKIFQKIFKTKPYEQLQILLSEEAKSIGAERERARQSISQYIAGIQIKPFSPYEKELQMAKNNEMPIVEVVELINKLIELDTKEKETVDNSLEAIDTQIAEINNSITIARTNKNNKKDLEQSKKTLDELTPRLADAKKQYDEQKSEKQRAIRNEISAKITLIEAEAQKYSELEEIQAEIATNTTESIQAQELINSTNECIKDILNEISKLEAEQKMLKNAPEEKARLDAKKRELLEKEKKLNTIQKTIQSIDEEEQNLEKSQQEYLKLSEISEQAYALYKEKQRAFLNEQAGILALDLKENEPCLVCGSLHHPSPAKKTNDAPSKQELEIYNAQSQEASEKAQEASIKCATIIGKLKELKSKLQGELNELFGSEAHLSKGSELFEEAQRALLSEFELVNDQIEQKEAQIERLEKLDEIILQEKERLDASRQKLTDLEKKITMLKTSLEALKKRQKQIQGELKYASKDEALDAKKELLTKQNELNKALEDAEEAFNTLNAEYISLNATINELTSQLKDAKDIDEDAEMNKLQALDIQKKELKDISQAIGSRISQNQYSLREINKKIDDVSDLDKKYAWVKALSDTANGAVSGKEKIKLETYIQMTYFDRIIRRANIRLLKMTNGQYELKRKTDENSKRAQSGLDLDVINHFDGTQRSVKTLSGGESFKASLSLALGLAEEIQSSAGGVQIDTMFVDEGFGSLDEDSIDKAMSALASLSDGNRLVGIISHVSELKLRIEKQIVIKKNKSGQSTATIIA